jgi:high affinity sulfate transporter 1
MAAPASAATPVVREAPASSVSRWLPGLAMLRAYKRSWLPQDLLAGLVLTAVLVPVGMGYAEAAGLPAINGLYATIVPLIAYAIFGPSRILVLGPDSALAGLVGATILPLSAGNPDRAIALAGMLAIMMGVIVVLAGIAKLGFVTELLSKPIRYGYLNGIAVTVLIGQLPKVFGFSVSSDNFLQEIGGLVQGIQNGQTNWTSFAIGVSCIVIILGFKRWAPRIPGILIAVIAATIAVAAFNLAAAANISVVGPLPQGLPSFHVPDISLNDFGALLAGAAAIALVASADMSVLSRTFAARGGYTVNSNQELVGLGAANVASGFFQGFSISGSGSRTPVAESAGAKTQITSLVGALCIVLLLVFVPSLLQNLPQAALGAVVICASLGLIEIAGVARLYRLRRSEFVLSCVCFLGVALLGVIQGIFLAIGLALLAFVWSAWRPYDAVLGRVNGLRGYHDISRHPEARLIPGLVLFRWDAPLFFANAEMFQEHVLQAVAEAPTPTRWVVIAAEPVTDIDTTAADALAELDKTLHDAGIELYFAELKGPVKDRLKLYGLFTEIGEDHFFRTLGQSVDSYLATHQVEWHDWDE